MNVAVALLLVVPLTVLGAFAPAAAVPCVDYNRQPLDLSTTPGSFGAHVLWGSRLLAADQANLLVLDFSDPRHPVTVGSVALSGTAKGIATSGDLAYVAIGVDGVDVVDLTDETQPAVVATVDTPGDARDITVLGDRLIVADYSNGVQLLSLADPASPQLLDTVQHVAYPATLVTNDGTHVYAAFPEEGPPNQYTVTDIGVIDPFSTPGALLGTVENVPLTAKDLAPGSSGVVGVSGVEYLFYQWSTNLFVIDASDPSQPTLSSNSLVDCLDEPTSLAVRGDEAWVAIGKLCVYEISNPSTPVLVEDMNQILFENLVITGNLLFASAYDGLHVFDVTYLAPEFTAVGSTTIGGLASITMANGYAYVGAWDGLHVVDIGNPAAPAEVGSLLNGLGDYHHEYVTSGSLLYGATDSAFRVIDVTDPAAPVQIGSVPVRCQDVELMGNLAVAAGGAPFAGGTGLHLIDVSDPATPSTTFTVPGDYRAVSSSEGYVIATRHLSSTEQTLQIIDVSAPSQPQLVGTYPLVAGMSWSAPVDRLEVRDGFVYANAPDPSGAGGVTILDVSDPQAPTLAGFLPAWGGAVSVIELFGDLLYVDAGNVRVFDVSNPATPALWGDHQTLSATALAADDTIVCTSGFPGLVLWPPACPVAATGATVPQGVESALLSVRPNPAREGTAISFRLPEPGLARVDVFDVTGRRVARVVDGRFDRGGTISWSGTAADGSPLSAGVYFVRLETRRADVTRKVVLLR